VTSTSQFSSFTDLSGASLKNKSQELEIFWGYLFCLTTRDDCINNSKVLPCFDSLENIVIGHISSNIDKTLYYFTDKWKHFQIEFPLLFRFVTTVEIVKMRLTECKQM
jgi:hypothetical protein